MMLTMQLQSKSPPKSKLDFKNASGKEILKYLDKFELKPEYFKKSEDVDQGVKLILQYVTASSECLLAVKKSGNPRQGSWFCKDCMKYKRVYAVNRKICIPTDCVKHGNVSSA